MNVCKNCGRRIWQWPSGIWTHRHNDMSFCYPMAGKLDLTKRAEPIR